MIYFTTRCGCECVVQEVDTELETVMIVDDAAQILFQSDSHENANLRGVEQALEWIANEAVMARIRPSLNDLVPDLRKLLPE